MSFTLEPIHILGGAGILALLKNMYERRSGIKQFFKNLFFKTKENESIF